MTHKELYVSISKIWHLAMVLGQFWRLRVIQYIEYIVLKYIKYIGQFVPCPRRDTPLPGSPQMVVRQDAGRAKGRGSRFTVIRGANSERYVA